MSKNIFTQKALAETLKEMLLEMPLEKITVKDISERCELSRNAYYYYFKDKYDLMWWIVEYEMRKTLNAYDSAKSISDLYTEICHHFYNNKKFYYPCLSYNGQNSIYEYLYDFFFNLIYSKLKAESVNHQLPVKAIPMDVYSRMLAFGMIEGLRQWGNDGMPVLYQDYTEPVNSFIDLVFKTYFRQS